MRGFKETSKHTIVDDGMSFVSNLFNQSINAVKITTSCVYIVIQAYLGDAHPDNLVLAQSRNHGNENYISRSFVLFKKKEEVRTDPPATDKAEGYVEMVRLWF